ncbi:MAG: hypothetical protein BGO38_15305 [Cellulomonas sp. 73-145]|uniref:DUF6049 family protein n=1 Tax=Cellulomonas sp. 73-145 TaxID=1895739 RepID=UPI00092806BF|nr:DUF6049 family protein [Cellulomonas sp. 73-145]OJV58740.1 MAG: hypothetical protein BGO38_15305 [Cellulomonas sp. 73-145]
MSRPVRRAPARATPVVLLAVLLIASTWVFGGAPAVAASGSPSPSASALDTDLPVSVSIQRVMPTVLRPGDDLTVSVTLRNTGSAGIADPTVALRINRLRPTTRAELSSWIDRSSGVVGVRLTTVHPGALAPGAQLNVDLTVPASAIGLNNVSSGWGPRGLSVDVTDDGGDRAGTARTFALWLPDGTVPQARVSVLLPLTGPARTPTVAGGANAGATPGATGASTSGATAGATPQPSPSGTASTPSSVAVAPSAAEQAALERLTTAGGRLRAVLDLARSSPDLGLAVDPALVADAQVSGAHARAWASDLGTALSGRETFALPWSDPDLATVAHGNGADLLRTAQQLSSDVGIGGQTARTDVLWAGPGAVDTSTLGLARTVGAAAVVVGPQSLQSVGGVATTARADVKTATGTMTALVPDDVLTSLLTDPESVEPGSTAATAVQRTLAELALLTRTGSSEPRDVLVAPSRDWSPDPTTAQAVLAALSSSPWSRLEPVSTALGNPDDRSKRAPLPASASAPDELAPATVQALATARTTTRAFASITQEPDTLLAGVDDEALTPLSVAWRSSPGDRDALAARLVQAIDDRRSGLSLAPVSNLNVISASVPYRFAVRNGLPVPVTVRVAVHPRKSCLGAATSDAVTVSAGAEASVPVVLHAAANCEVIVDAQVTDLAGQPVGTGAQFTARVAPTVENVGTAVVGALLAIGLVLGIVRTVRRGQSARRGARRTSEDEAPPLPPLGGDVSPGRPS